MNNFLADVLPQEGGLVASPSRSYNAVIAIGALLAALGLAAGLHSMYAGHEHTFGVTRDVPWGLLIAAYVFFVVSSTGLCLVSSIGHVFGVEAFKPIAKRSVFMAIVTIVAGFFVIGFEIENPWRMPIYNMLSPNPTSISGGWEPCTARISFSWLSSLLSCRWKSTKPPGCLACWG